MQSYVPQQIFLRKERMRQRNAIIANSFFAENWALNDSTQKGNTVQTLKWILFYGIELITDVATLNEISCKSDKFQWLQVIYPYNVAYLNTIFSHTKNEQLTNWEIFANLIEKRYSLTFTHVRWISMTGSVINLIRKHQHCNCDYLFE